MEKIAKPRKQWEYIILLFTIQHQVCAGSLEFAWHVALKTPTPGSQPQIAASRGWSWANFVAYTSWCWQIYPGLLALDHDIGEDTIVLIFQGAQTTRDYIPESSFHSKTHCCNNGSQRNSHTWIGYPSYKYPSWVCPGTKQYNWLMHPSWSYCPKSLANSPFTNIVTGFILSPDCRPIISFRM